MKCEIMHTHAHTYILLRARFWSFGAVQKAGLGLSHLSPVEESSTLPLQSVKRKKKNVPGHDSPATLDVYLAMK